MPIIRRSLSLVLVALAVLGAFLVAPAVVPAWAGDDGDTTETVTPSTFVLRVELEGKFAPRDAVEVAYEAEVYGGKLEVVEAVEGVRQVEKGEVLVRFDEEEGARLLHQAEQDLQASRAKLVKQEADARLKAEARARKLDELEQKARDAEADFAYWREVEKPLRIERAAYNMKGTENRLQDQIEELEQLEKMYKEDDLTEETEEIVIRRARRRLARSRKSLEFARVGYRRLLETSIPRDEIGRRRGVEARKADLASYRVAAKAESALSDIAMQKAKEAFERQEKRFEDLRGDVDGLRLRAPESGLLVPGRFASGAWQDVQGTTRLLAKKGKAKKGQTLFTILTPGNVRVLTSVGEKDLLKLAEGQKAEVRATVLGDKTFEAVVSQVWPLASKGRCPVQVDLRETDALLMPGESAKVKIAWKVVEGALTVPVKAIRKKDGKVLVWVVKGEKDEAREIETGEKADDRVLVLSGLEAGERILKVAPEEKKAAAKEKKESKKDGDAKKEEKK